MAAINTKNIGPHTPTPQLHGSVEVEKDVKLGKPTSLIGAYGKAVAQPVAAGLITGFVAGSGAPVLVDSTFTGNVGSSAYTMSDVVKALKDLGWLAA